MIDSRDPAREQRAGEPKKDERQKACERGSKEAHREKKGRHLLIGVIIIQWRPVKWISARRGGAGGSA